MCDEVKVGLLGDILQAVMGFVSLAAVAALPIVFMFRVTRNPILRGLMVALVLSPISTLLLGCVIGGIRYGANRGRGLYPQVFTESFISPAILVSFLAWWVVSALFLERRAAKAAAGGVAHRRGFSRHADHETARETSPK